MTRTTTPDQLTLLNEPVTRPIYLVALTTDESELLSTNGDVVVAGDLYAGGELDIISIDDWRQARINLPPTDARTAQMYSQAWRYGTCQVFLLPSVYYPQLLDPGYVETGYALEGVSYADPILLVDGELVAAERGEVVSYTVENRVAAGRWLPGIRLTPPSFNHMPKPGTQFVWEGDRFILEAR